MDEWLRLANISLLAQAGDDSHASIDYWLDKGVMGAILFFSALALAWFLRELWKLKKPQLVEHHEKQMKMFDTMTENSTKQTQILDSLKNSTEQHVAAMSEHSKNCVAQADDANALRAAACVRLEQIETRVGNHNTAAEKILAHFDAVVKLEYPSLYERHHIGQMCGEISAILRGQSRV